MAPIKSSLARSAKQLLGLFNTADLGLRGATQESKKFKIPLATGGTITQPGDGYVYHTFIVNVSSPYPNVTPNTSETFQTGAVGRTCDYLIIGGGGAGGHSPSGQTTGGGGGAGAVIYKSGVALSASTTYPVTVGKGGEANPAGDDVAADNDGDASVFNSLTANGGGAGGRGGGAGEAARSGGSGGGGGAGYPGNPRSGGAAPGTSTHPGSGTDVASPDAGWGTAGGSGGGSPNNTSSGGGGGGAGGGGTNGASNYPPGSAGGDGGIGANYTVNGTAKGVGGGAHAGSYNVAGRTGNAILYGGGHQESDPWNSALSSVGGGIGSAIPLIYPADQTRHEGLDGTGGGGTGGARGTKLNGGPNTNTSARGGCGLVQIRYSEPT